MPIYEFRCGSCNKDFEELVRTSRTSQSVVCPKCGSKDVERKFSVFSARASAAPPCGLSSSEACGGCCGGGRPCGLGD